VVLETHLDGIDEGVLRLVLEARGPAVPELHGEVGEFTTVGALRVPVSALPAFLMPSEVRSGLSVKAFFAS